MKIAIDESPLKTGHFLKHRVRGTGFYIRNLKESLTKYYPKDDFIFFQRGQKIPENVQLVHYPYFEPFFITLPFLNNNKTIVTVHDFTPLVFPDKLPKGVKGSIKWKIQKQLLKGVDAIITDSYSSKKDIIELAGVTEKKIHVVYLAASEKFKPNNSDSLIKTKKKYNLPEKFLLYVGDVTWNKNLPNLIEAVQKTDYNLVIAGDAFKNEDFDHSNPWNKDLAKAQELAKSNKKIKALGFVSDEELADLYNLATVFIMPSFYEGFGLPVLEAMQSGCPVVTSDKGSLKEVCGDAVLYVDPQSVESIKNGIEKIMGDSTLREKLSKKGLEQAAKFNWKKTADQTVKVYEKIFSEKK